VWIKKIFLRMKNLRLKFDSSIRSSSSIKFVGIGGCGINLLEALLPFNWIGVSYIAMNTDSQTLLPNKPYTTLQLGEKLTKKMGTGGEPEVGKLAVEESYEEVMKILPRGEILFVMAGMGGGTGTGGAPILSKIGKEKDNFVIGVSTLPFKEEGEVRKEIAYEGIREWKKYTDILILFPNQELFSFVYPELNLMEGFTVANKRIAYVVKGIMDIINLKGIINVDLQDVKEIMKDTGWGFTGIGVDRERNSNSIQKAMRSMNVVEETIKKTKGVVVNLKCGKNTSMKEMEESMEVIYSTVDKNTKVIFGVTLDETQVEKTKALIIISGVEEIGFEVEENLVIPTIRRKRRNEMYEIY
jgi:cell division protein FtsZ